MRTEMNTVLGLMEPSNEETVHMNSDSIEAAAAKVKDAKGLLSKDADHAVTLLSEATKPAETLLSNATEDAKVVLSEATKPAEALLSQATEDAKVLLSQATEAVEADETAEALLSKATETAEALLSKATEEAKMVLSNAIEDAKVLLSEADGTAETLLSKATMTAEVLLARVKRLEGIIPICSYCKNIRNDQDSWQQLEHYMSEHSDAWFSHGICPDCAEKLKSNLSKE